jgi:hypothetical protein
MEIEEIFEKLWIDYSRQNPSAEKIHSLFTARGEKVVNDHIAFRTFNDPRMDTGVLAEPFLRGGYVQAGIYEFEKKHLKATHFELPGNDYAPRVFISQLILEDFSKDLQLLKQSSTMADIVSLEFAEGYRQVPACYYEFAERFEDTEGKLFSGFIAGSADKIFESTDFYKKKGSDS